MLIDIVNFWKQNKVNFDVIKYSVAIVVLYLRVFLPYHIKLILFIKY